MSERPADVAVTAGGDPTEEELAAIVAAVEVAWPKAVAATPPESPPRWRFSGRWWSKPVPLRRSRPW
ncbi:MAG TPA: acyl-CoA carboxylase epsilon subunit [Acidimicrobiales bacterium]